MAAIRGFFGKLGGRTASENLRFAGGGAASPAMAPLTPDVLDKGLPHALIVPLSPEELATATVQGAMSKKEAAAEAELSGISGPRFDALFHINGNPIAPEQALDLWNRGEINEGDVGKALLQSRLKPEWVDTFKLLRRAILQAAELA